MPTSRMTSKGQVTVPKPIRELLGLEPGDRVAFRVEDGAVVLVPETVDLLSLRGSLCYDGPPRSVEEMNAAVRERVQRRRGAR